MGLNFVDLRSSGAMVERLLPEQEVSGSNPLASRGVRSNPALRPTYANAFSCIIMRIGKPLSDVCPSLA